MIPAAYIQAWSATAPWPDPRQVEQDLIICRALCDLFNAPALKGKIAFRGGTAINKLLFSKPLRYSEDIDLVQTQAEPIGITVNAIRDTLSWLGKCNREQARHSMHLVFKFTPEADMQSTLKLKVEINTREHDFFSDLSPTRSRWKTTGIRAMLRLPRSNLKSFSAPSCVPCSNVARTVTCSTCITRP